MLSLDVKDLASRSLEAELPERRAAFPIGVRRILEELATRNIGRSGASVTAVTDAAVAECRTRIDIATAELQRAADSKGVRYYVTLGADLGTALVELSQNLYGDVDTAGRTTLPAVAPNASSAAGMFQSSIQEAVGQRLNKGKTDLEHYAETLRTRERQRSEEAKLQFRERVVSGVIGGVIGAAATFLVQWIAHLLHVG
ncbi:MAG: hypothetical protein WCB99_04105 [Candidatus Cybelea sp.]